MVKDAPIFFGQDAEAPKDLPEVKPAAKKSVLDAARICPKCGSNEIRINSSLQDRRAFCGCGYNWAISMPAVAIMPDRLMERGLRKETLVEPDWETAYEDLDGPNTKEEPE